MFRGPTLEIVLPLVTDEGELLAVLDIDSDREENSLISKVKLLLSFLSKRILKNPA